MFFLTLAGGCFTGTAPSQGQVGELLETLKAQDKRIVALEEEMANLRTMIEVDADGDLLIGDAEFRGTTKPSGVASKDVIISGANVFVVNGEDNTATANGTGNVILGYGEIGIDPEHTLDGWDEELDVEARRAGSHNLVIGPRHGYTAWGSVIVGTDNRAEAPGSVVIGRRNLAVHDWEFEELHGAYGNLVTGFDNRAEQSAFGAVVGGNSNWVSGQSDTIVGGSTNQPTAGVGNRTYVGAHRDPDDPVVSAELTTMIGGGNSILYVDDVLY